MGKRAVMGGGPGRPFSLVAGETIVSMCIEKRFKTGLDKERVPLYYMFHSTTNTFTPEAMMAVRKNVSVKAILEFQEKTALRSDKGATRERREGVNLMTEHFLHEAGAYAGFMYLDASYLPEGVAPGIIRGENGADNQYPDDSRRWYYTHNKLK